jgi:glycosyltransferase involved in cell wall biosynthesis
VKYTSLDILGEEKIADEYDLRAFASSSKGKLFYSRWASYLETGIDISKFDVIQLNSLLFIDAWIDKPRIFTIHTNPFEYQLDWGYERFDWVGQRIRKALPDKTLLVAPSEYYSKYFSRIFHRDVLTIPHAIDTSRLSSISRTHTRTSRELTMGRGITILLPSRLELVQKRPQIVFRGVALLPAQLRTRITIVTTGKDRQYQSNYKKLECIAKNGGFNARFTKFRSMAEAYALADIVALPSKSESFGYTALESLALGIPTILNSIPTYKEIGSGNSNAYFFNQSAQAFSQTLLKLLQDLRKRHTDEIWLMRYDIQRWAEVYQGLAGNIIGHE